MNAIQRDINSLRDEIRRLSRADVRRAPDSGSDFFLQVIGGNTLTAGQEGISYSASVTPTKVYDPDVDTVYPAGLGNAWLYVNRIRQNTRVLVRHDDSAHQTPYLAGRRCRVLSIGTLAYSGTDMAIYRVTWE